MHAAQFSKQHPQKTVCVLISAQNVTPSLPASRSSLIQADVLKDSIENITSLSKLYLLDKSVSYHRLFALLEKVCYE